jgi:hypothetical protein
MLAPAILVVLMAVTSLVVLRTWLHGVLVATPSPPLTLTLSCGTRQVSASSASEWVRFHVDVPTDYDFKALVITTPQPLVFSTSYTTVGASMGTTRDGSELMDPAGPGALILAMGSTDVSFAPHIEPFAAASGPVTVHLTVWFDKAHLTAPGTVHASARLRRSPATEA